MRPTPWGSNEWEWRRAIAGKARESGLEHATTVTSETQFDVRIVFWMNSLNIGRADLDHEFFSIAVAFGVTGSLVLSAVYWVLRFLIWWAERQ